MPDLSFAIAFVAADSPETLCRVISLGLAIFGLYLAYDTQLIIGGHRYELSPEDYIVGAMDLFVDIMEIFFSLLALLNENE
ncbi:unnamed protein product [Dibothriocephalus latus]|uniref:Uncharacterized protein n=1 Tax=Dibothriocephalus latus TaxID=60516 RepID=A0A3P7LR36_DIBLA|nr:unnamed protein product [Dibothriocephalus latus]